MPHSINQQIVISGVGGQGVLFVTRLLAEAAISKGYRVLTSETHGMAQRGGTVISHLKVGNFFSPLIRPYTADGMLALKAENITHHGSFLKPDGWLVVNAANGKKPDGPVTREIFAADADRLAQEIKNPKSVNLVLLGYALKKISTATGDNLNFFCSLADIQEALSARMAGNKKMLKAALLTLKTGYNTRSGLKTPSKAQ
jgi:indolepyruvate ferredoxin oxidoreductase beta subunit